MCAVTIVPLTLCSPAVIVRDSILNLSSIARSPSFEHFVRRSAKSQGTSNSCLHVIRLPVKGNEPVNCLCQCISFRPR